jgi:hypothetical protein
VGVLIMVGSLAAIAALIVGAVVYFDPEARDR